MRLSGRLNSRVHGLIVGTARHLPLVVLGISVAVNVALATRLLHAQPKSPMLAIGTTVAPFDGRAPVGYPISIQYDGDEPTILYYFSPSCSWCERNWANVRELAAGTRSRYRFVALSGTPVTPLFASERELAFDIAGDVDANVLQRYQLRGTPQTLVISPDGQILRGWTGAYTGLQAKEIEAYFGVRLPGLISVSGR